MVAKMVREPAEQLPRRHCPNQASQGKPKLLRVVVEIEHLGEALQFQHCFRRKFMVADQLVGRAILEHVPVLADQAADGRARQEFQESQLQFVGPECQHGFERSANGRLRFARQPPNQVGVEVDASGLSEPPDRGEQLFHVLLPLDSGVHLRVGGLDAHLELEHPPRRLIQKREQLLVQQVAHHLEMKLHCRKSRQPAEQPQHPPAAQVEGAVQELDAARPPFDQLAHRFAHLILGEEPHLLVQRGKAKRAGERASSRGFQVHQTVLQVGVIFLQVGQLLQRGQLRPVFGPASAGRGVWGAPARANLQQFHPFQLALSRDDLVHVG